MGSAPNLDGDMSEDVMFEHGGAEHGRSTGGGAGADNSLGGMGMSPDTSPTKGFRQSEVRHVHRLRAYLGAGGVRLCMGGHGFG